MPLFSPAPRSAFAHSRDDSDSSEEESSSSDEEEYLPPAIEHFNYPPLQAYRKKLIQTIIGPAYHLATTEGPDAVIEFWKLAEAMWIELFWFEENSFRIMDEHKNYIRRKVREYKPADGDVIEVDAGNWRAELTTGDPKDHYTVVHVMHLNHHISDGRIKLLKRQTACYNTPYEIFDLTEEWMMAAATCAGFDFLDEYPIPSPPATPAQ